MKICNGEICVWVECCHRNYKGSVLSHSCHKLCGLGQITIPLRISIFSSIMFIGMTRYTINSHFNILDSEKARARLEKSNRKLKKDQILSTKIFRVDMCLWSG